MSKTSFQKPVLICLYGYPGAGKTYVARQLSEILHVVHVSNERIRAELFEQPRFDREENAIVTHLMNYMTHEFLAAGVSVIYDVNALRSAQRRELREMARRNHAHYLLIWLQVDSETAFYRTQKRDRRTMDDRYAMPHSRESFDYYANHMQPPSNEDYIVISGKHPFGTQKNAILNKLYTSGLITTGLMTGNVAKPGLVNLIPNPSTQPNPSAGRVDLSRRNISIR